MSLWQILQQDKGGTLEHYVTGCAPLAPAASPAPSVTLYTPNGVTVLLASQAATRGPSTAVGAAGASAGDTEVPLASTSGLVVGRQYYIGPSAALGQWESVTLTGVGPTSVHLRDELLYSYAEDDAFVSHRLSVAVAGASVPTRYRGCMARWSYTIDGQAYTEDTLFSISKWGPQCPLTRQDVLLRHAQAEHLLGSRQRLGDIIDALWGELLSDMAMRVDPGALVSGLSLKTALLYRVLADIPAANDSEEQRATYWQKFEAEWERVLDSAPIDVNDDGVIDDDDIVEPANIGRLWRG